MSRSKEAAVTSDLLERLLAGGDAAAALHQGRLRVSLRKSSGRTYAAATGSASRPRP